uniref:Uncharacterized protein n=1 Tax=Wuchereria bancrofti TaxID=6293 RepID=A0AAF5RTP3_WUCBA
MISLILFLGISCIAPISSQLFQSRPHFYAIKKFSLPDLKRFSGENIDDTAMNSKDGHMLIEERTQLTQLNRLLKKPVFNFANLFRRN